MINFSSLQRFNFDRALASAAGAHGAPVRVRVRDLRRAAAARAAAQRAADRGALRAEVPGPGRFSGLRFHSIREARMHFSVSICVLNVFLGITSCSAKPSRSFQVSISTPRAEKMKNSFAIWLESEYRTALYT